MTGNVMVNLSLILRLTSYSLMLISLMLAGVKDYKVRLVNDTYWIPAIISIPIAIYLSVSSPISELTYIVNAAFGAAMAGLIYMGKFMGDADSIAILLISLGTPAMVPSSPVLILLNLPIISVLINSIIPTIMLMLINIYSNIKNQSRCADPSITRIMLLRCVSVESVLRNPLAYSSPDSSYLRAGSNAEAYVAGLPRDSWIWMQYNYPYVFILAISYLVYLMAGNLIINLLLIHRVITPIIYMGENLAL